MLPHHSVTTLSIIDSEFQVCDGDSVHICMKFTFSTGFVLTPMAALSLTTLKKNKKKKNRPYNNREGLLV